MDLTKAKEKHSGRIVGNSLKEMKAHDLCETAELMYQPDLKSVLLLDFPLCEKITLMCEPSDSGFLSPEVENTLADKRCPRWDGRKSLEGKWKESAIIEIKRKNTSIWEDKHKRHIM